MVTGNVKWAPPPPAGKSPGGKSPEDASPPPREAVESFGRALSEKEGPHGKGQKAEGRGGGAAGEGEMEGAGGSRADKASGASKPHGQAGAAPSLGQGMAGMTKKDKGAGGFMDLLGEATRGWTGHAADPAAAAQGQGMANSMAAGMHPAAGAAEPGGADAIAQARCGELVERILVSMPQDGGPQEVRLKLDQSWLPDTEVRIALTGSGLSVEFLSDHVDAQRFLMPNLSALRERLAEQTSQSVTVRMTEAENAGRGAGGDTGDGRSRNRRNLYEEAGEE